MENLPPPNDNQNALEEEPFMDQAPAAFDVFVPHWFGEHFSNINNGWIELDVPLGGEVHEPMVDPEVNEEVMDDDDLDVEVEWLMAPVTPPRATMTVSSTYEVGVIENLGTRLGNLEYRHGVLTRKMEETRVAEMESHICIVMPYMLWMEERLTVLEKRLPRPPPGPQ
nr:hypothetical protein [Tanacetum cinerariifolium]